MMRNVSSPDPSTPATTERETRDALLHELSALTLPMMWVLRQSAVRALEPLGLRPLKALILGLVAAGPQSPKDLAELLDTAPPMMSSMLADLEQRGLISRRPDPDDRRRVLVEATPTGLELTARITEFWVDAGRERLRALDDDDLRHLVRVYRTIVEAS